MKVEVKYFGMIAEALERQEEIHEFTGNSAIDLRTYFQDRYPVLQSMTYSIAVNQEFKDELNPSDNITEIALLPPFAGG